MWSVIPCSHYDHFISTHPELDEYKDHLILYHSKRHNLYILPRLFYKTYPYQYLKLWKPDDIQYQSLYDTDNPIEFVFNLRPSQKELFKRIEYQLKLNGYVNGIIHARPGTGKTILSIYSAVKFNWKPLFIVDNQKLRDQWIKEILACTNCTEDQIGLIQGNKLDISNNKAFTIAMVQTLMSRAQRNPMEYYRKFKEGGFNLIVYDECHKTTAGEQFSKASLFITTPNILGLSATPFPSKLQEILLFNTIGPVIATHGDYDIVPKIVFVKYKSNLSTILNKKEYNKITYLLRTNRFMGVAQYNSKIVDSPKYLTIIRDLTKDLLKNNHRIIIIASTVKQVQTISHVLKNNNIDCIEFYSKQQKIDKENDKVLVATYKFASHGFDYKELSSIILACPLAGKTSLIQCIGRVLRSAPNKDSAIVYDLIDMDFSHAFANKTLQIKRNILSSEFKNCKFIELDYD